MKNKFTLRTFVFFCLLSGNLLAQNFWVPDANFRVRLKQLYPFCFQSGDSLSSQCIQMMYDTSLDISNRNIQDISGIEFAKSLRTLNISGNPITNFFGITDSLKRLICVNNSLTDLSFLPSSLQYLDCRNNPLVTINNLPDSLKYLDCRSTQLTNITFPGSLVVLNCSSNSLSILPPLPNSLTKLYCEANHLTSLSTLSNSLAIIYCGGNHLTSLPSLPNSLKELWCQSNQITNLPVLPGFLNIIDCSNNKLANLPVLPSSLLKLICKYDSLLYLPPLPSSLTELNCSRNQLTYLPALPNSLKKLYCTNNNLLNLPTLPDSLIYLNCTGNNLNGFPPLPNFLRTIIADNNQLISLPALPDSLRICSFAYNQLTWLPTLPQKLDGLECSFNQLTVLPSLPNSLGSLYCINNNLTSLPTLSSGLAILACDNNQLSTIPAFPQNLEYLSCSYNSITSLPPLNQYANEVYCHHNMITSLPTLSSAMYLWTLDCSDNPISCLPLLPDAHMNTFVFKNTLVTCLPNIPVDLIFIPFNIPPCSSSFTTCNFPYMQGFVFNDNNANGIKDSVERGMNLKIKYSGNFSAQCDGNGFFTALCDTGNVTFQVSIPEYFSPTTPSQQTSHITINHVDTIFFGLQSNCMSKDLKIDITPHNRFRSGFKVASTIHYENVGTQTLSNVIVKYLKPASLSNLTSTPASTGTNGDTLFWNIGTLNPFEGGFISVLDSVSAAALSGTIVNPEAWIIPFVGDSTLQNNHCISYEIVRVSSDPNDKSVTPEFISPTQNDYLEYVIRFQNTGTDTAFSILVTDTLSADMDVASIQLISSSHSCNFWVEHGIAKWHFANILLPDSNVNEAASHGFVKFRIMPKSNLTIGTQIPNSANIYFDYNAAVITNTIVVNVTPLSVKTISDDFKLAVFPNPVHQTVHLVSTNNKPLGKVELVNATGKIIETKNIGTSSYDWQVASLPDGVYLFKGENWQEKIVKK